MPIPTLLLDTDTRYVHMSVPPPYKRRVHVDGSYDTEWGVTFKDEGDMVGVGEYSFTDGKTVHGPDYEEAVGIVKVPDITVARSVGWQPQVGLDEMIARTFVDIDDRQEVA